MSLQSQIVHVLQYDPKLHLYQIEDIHIVYLHQLSCLGAIIYFHDNPIFRSSQKKHTEENENKNDINTNTNNNNHHNKKKHDVNANINIFQTIFNKYFNIIRFIDNKCKKYWECPHLKCCYQFNLIDDEINNRNVFFCEKCKGDLTYHHNPNNHFYLSLNHHSSSIGFIPKQRSCIKYRYLTPKQFNAMITHNIHITNNNNNHHHHNQSSINHKKEQQQQIKTIIIDPVQQEQQKKKCETTMGLFSKMSHQQFQEMIDKDAQKQINPDINDNKQQHQTEKKQIEDEHDHENNEEERDWIDQLTLNNLTMWFDHKPGTV